MRPWLQYDSREINPPGHGERADRRPTPAATRELFCVSPGPRRRLSHVGSHRGCVNDQEAFPRREGCLMPSSKLQPEGGSLSRPVALIIRAPLCFAPIVAREVACVAPGCDEGVVLSLPHANLRRVTSLCVSPKNQRQVSSHFRCDYETRFKWFALNSMRKLICASRSR